MNEAAIFEIALLLSAGLVSGLIVLAGIVGWFLGRAGSRQADFDSGREIGWDWRELPY